MLESAAFLLVKVLVSLFTSGMADSDIRIYEVTFCSRVAGWLNALFALHPEWPFRRAEIEESKAIHRKRSDLRIYGDAEKLVDRGTRS